MTKINFSLTDAELVAFREAARTIGGSFALKLEAAVIRGQLKAMKNGGATGGVSNTPANGNGTTGNGPTEP